MFERVLRVGYSLASGLATGILFAFSIHEVSENIPASLVVAGLGFFVDGFAAYNFQGKSICKSEQDDCGDKYQLFPNARDSTFSIVLQSAYLLLNLSKNFANRYFFLLTLCDLFSLEDEGTANAKWVVLGFDLLIKQLFDLTNETWESAGAIAEKIDGREKPIYAGIFTPLSGPKMRKTISVVGSLEHALCDDLIPWLALLPKEAIHYLAKNSYVRNWVLSVSAFIGIPLALLVFVQTYLFEGRHTEINLANLKEETVSEHLSLPNWALDFLEKSINIMGPLHGAAAGVPVFKGLNTWIKDNQLKWPVSVTLGGLTFLATALGTDRSEVKEARQIIHDSRGTTTEPNGSQMA